LREVNGILLAAVAFGWLADAPLAAERDRLGGILFGLQRRVWRRLWPHRGDRRGAILRCDR
jgi:cation transport regulator ChaC